MDRQNYISQDRASIAASHSKNWTTGIPVGIMTGHGQWQKTGQIATLLEDSCKRETLGITPRSVLRPFFQDNLGKPAPER